MKTINVHRLPSRHRRRGAIALIAGLALIAAACGDDDDNAGSAPATEASTTNQSATAPTTAPAAAPTTAPAAAPATTGSTGAPVTIDWWHIQNNDPGMSDWQAMADAYTADHPNVKIKINVMANQAFKDALQTNLQAGDVPDLFQSWGGGGLRDQVKAGLVQDITAPTSSWIGDLGAAPVGLYQVDGKQYGVPFDAGIVGIWYNKDLFAKAGLDKPADTWDGLLDQIKTLKAAGITPIAVGAGDKWPAHFWYAYLMVRLGGADAMNQIAATNDFNVPNVIDAGKKVADLVALDPFQAGFLGAQWDAPDGESGTMASGGAAMDLMGQWAPGAFRTQAGVTNVSDLPFQLGWAPFPSVSGGSGAGTDVFGGGNGFAVGKDAPPEAVDFLHFLTNQQNQETWAKDSGLPVNKAAAGTVADPNMQAVLSGLKSATFMQLFLDQFFSAEVGAAINDQTALLFAGKTTPEDAAKAITTVAKGA